MSQYIIMTDSSCDLPAGLAAELELEVLPLSVLIDGKSYVNYLDERDITFADCYAALRAGKNATTSAVNVEAFVQAMEPHLQAGEDILYLGFSSALSGTYNAGAVAAQQLAEKYPERKLYAVDTLSASMGQGLLVYLTVQQKRAGATIEQARDYAEAQKLHLCHWFTVDDLNHLHRGGRVSATSAVSARCSTSSPCCIWITRDASSSWKRCAAAATPSSVCLRRCARPPSSRRSRSCSCRTATVWRTRSIWPGASARSGA